MTANEARELAKKYGIGNVYVTDDELVNVEFMADDPQKGFHIARKAIPVRVYKDLCNLPIDLQGSALNSYIKDVL